MSAVTLVRGSIVDQRVDTVVNAANSSLLGGGGVDGAIHFAGGPQILAACRALRETRYPRGLPAGQAVATTAGELPARWVIHTVGPVWSAREDRSATLRACYTSSLEVATQLGARSVAFPLVSAGAFGWPVEDAVREALAGIRAAGGDHEIRLVLFGGAPFAAAKRVLAAVDDGGDRPSR